MPERDIQELYEDLNFVTGKISSQVWTLNLGTLGTTWSFLIAAGNIPEKFRFSPVDAFPILTLCLLGMILDLAQYLVGYWNDKRIKDEIEQKKKTKFEYDADAPLYRLRQFFFGAKIVFTLCGSGWLVLRIVLKLF